MAKRSVPDTLCPLEFRVRVWNRSNRSRYFFKANLWSKEYGWYSSGDNGAAFIIGGLGLAAAIARGWLDQLFSRTVDVLMAIPSLIFALVLLSIFGSTVTNLIIIIAVLDSTRVFRLTRAVSINVVVMDYVEAARLRGEGLIWIMRREILPNIMPPLIAEFGLRFCFVFLTIAALSFGEWVFNHPRLIGVQWYERMHLLFNLHSMI